MSLTDVPDRMSWGEAWRLTHVLSTDPSSHVAAALGEWEHPVSREWLVLATLVDLYVAARSKKGRGAKAYPRPWPDRTKSRPRPTVTPEVAVAALREAGHTAALPAQFRHLDVPPDTSIAALP